MRRNRNRNHPFRGLRPPGPPIELRRRALDAARATSTEPAETAEASALTGERLTDRLWESWPLRVAWALLVVALLGANLLLELRESIDRRQGSLAERAHPAGEAAPGGGKAPWTLLESRDVVLRTVLGEGSVPGAERAGHPTIRRTS